jgi:hypothetical protein
MLPKRDPKVRGALLLRQWLEADSRRTALLSLLLGVSDVTIWSWQAARRMPKPHFRAAMALLCGIAEHEWLTEAEQALVARIEKAVADGSVQLAA